jgi:NAD(P)-dependent dehydrogenase (short-subunit alcohol dehydrogenase family)
MMSPVTDKVIAITGGASGIGLATATLLAERGARLSLADLNDKALETASSLIKSSSPDVQIITTVLDVRSTEAVDNWIAKTVSHFGQLDGAVNLAGVIGPSIGVKGVAELSDEEWDFVSGVNLTGTFKCLRAQLKAINDGGSIVNAASIAGIRGFAFNPAYTASKHGVVGLTKGSAKEVGNRNIRVNCICPYVVP